jgi:hypothetical protein
MNPEQKICKDCIHARPTAWWDLIFIFNRYEYAMCAAETNPVDGVPEHYCSTQRQWFGECKPQGLLFEPKNTQRQKGAQ